MAGNEERRNSGGFLEKRFPPSASRPTFLSTFDRESYYPIFDTFCKCLPIAEIVSLTRTCKKLSGLYQRLVPVYWDVDKALSHYVDDPRGFRSQMAKCDALVSGNFVNAYFERAVWDHQSLGIFVEQGHGPELLSKYLSDQAGYVCVKRDDFDDQWNTIKAWTFKRNSDYENKVYLFITRCQPIKSLLLETYTTIGLSFLSWNKAYSVFALPTFVQHKSYMLKDLDERTRGVVQDESLEGCKVQGVMWPEEKRSNHPIRKRRRIGDRYTWTIPFETRNVESSKTPDYVLEYACFNMDVSMSYDDNNVYDRKQEDVRHYTIETHTLKSRVLKHTYLCTDAHMREFFSSRLHSFALFEVRALVPAKRPANYYEIMRNRVDIYSALEGFDRPPEWTYRDDEFPTWYEAFEKHCPE